MDEDHLYKQIAEAFRRDILDGKLKPGERLPSVREISERWKCTVGTAQHAYRELANQGLVTSRAGQGTRVMEQVLAQDETPMRRALLVHRAEAFLLEVLTGGYALDEVEWAVRQAMDRWRSMGDAPTAVDENILRFAGSHDLVITWLAGHFAEIAPSYLMRLDFSGSLGGLIALAEGQADLAGSHLWDEDSDRFNTPFVRRLLPGQRAALVTLAHRRLGLIVPAGNPSGLQDLRDLSRPGLRFVNRQPGSGTRVWLDANMKRLGMQPTELLGYDAELKTHSAVAQAVAESRADVGLGLQASALSYRLDFIPLTSERYDLVIPETSMHLTCIQSLIEWLQLPASRRIIEELGGYDTHQTGHIQWV
jgi:molybdate-binding protein/DNA-binding transcriptional regulator YhcF (GntR family)